jgi:hypothetical protein
MAIRGLLGMPFLRKAEAEALLTPEAKDAGSAQFQLGLFDHRDSPLTAPPDPVALPVHEEANGVKKRANGVKKRKVGEAEAMQGKKRPVAPEAKAPQPVPTKEDAPDKGRKTLVLRAVDGIEELFGKLSDLLTKPFLALAELPKPAMASEPAMAPEPAKVSEPAKAPAPPKAPEQPPASARDPDGEIPMSYRSGAALRGKRRFGNVRPTPVVRRRSRGLTLQK